VVVHDQGLVGEVLSLPATEAVVAAAEIEECCGACILGFMLFKARSCSISRASGIVDCKVEWNEGEGDLGTLPMLKL
jgi:hypothetical protein